MKIISLLRDEGRLFLVAIQFLTRLPTPDWPQFSPLWLNQCVRYFPLVGVVVGGLGVVTLCLSHYLWPGVHAHAVQSILVIATTVVVTGAFHEDGLADTMDALGGCVSRERALEIMKDSRIGTYGASALILSLSLRIGLLIGVLQQSLILACFGLMASHVLGRTLAVGVMASLPYAGDAAQAKAKPLATDVSKGILLATMLCSLIILAISHGLLLIYQPTFPLFYFWAICGLSLLILWACFRYWIQRRIGGYTGDTLGAAEQLAEVVVWLCVLALLLHHTERVVP